ncbi:MAG TPA: hypothetical protein VF215_11650, partial [Thermoanaerobaculia bacterium]
APVEEIVAPPPIVEEEPSADVFAEAPADPIVEEAPAVAAETVDVPLAAPEPQFEFPPLAIEPEVTFSEAEKPQQKDPEVKTVKVRSSVDVMAELEALRKRATNTTPKAQRRDVLADLDSLRPKRDLNRTLHVQLPTGVLSRTKTVRVTLAFEDGQEAVIDTQNQQLELGDASDVQSLSVNLKIDLA